MLNNACVSSLQTSVYISSFREMSNNNDCNAPFPTYINYILSKSVHDKLLYIPQASYVYSTASSTGVSKPIGEQRRRLRYDAKAKMNMIKSCFKMQSCELLELDSKDITDSKIDKALSDASMVYIDGGNTYVLQKYLIKTNFWSIIDKYLHTSNLLYIGASAGAIVAGKGLQVVGFKGWDNIDDAGEMIEYWDERALSGRSLSSYSYFMHYNKETHYDLVVNESKNLNHVVRTVRDDTAIIESSDANGVIDTVVMRKDGVELKLKQQDNVEFIV